MAMPRWYNVNTAACSRSALWSTRKTTTDPHGREGRGELRLYTIVLREAKLPETKPAIINNVTTGTRLGCLSLRRGGRKPTAARLPAGREGRGIVRPYGGWQTV